jgi:hypothetical protein
MGSFADSIKANIKELQQEVNDRILTEASKTFIDVTTGTPSDWQNSPYAKGLLSNQWYVAENKLSSELTDAKDLHGSASLNRANSVLNWKTFIGKDGYVSFTNNVHYAINAEVLGWKTEDNPNWRNAKPYAMVEKAMIDAKNRMG